MNYFNVKMVSYTPKEFYNQFYSSKGIQNVQITIHGFSFTPLEWAAIKGHTDIVKLMVDSSNYELVLHLAATHGHLKIIKLLYKNFKADLASIVDTAVENGYLDIVKYTHSKCVCDASLFIRAILYNHVDIAKYLYSKKIYKVLDTHHIYGLVSNTRIESIQFVLKKNLADKDKILDIAVLFRNDRVLSILLQMNIYSKKRVDKFKDSFLLLIAKYCNKEEYEPVKERVDEDEEDYAEMVKFLMHTKNQ